MHKIFKAAVGASVGVAALVATAGSAAAAHAPAPLPTGDLPIDALTEGDLLKPVTDRLGGLPSGDATGDLSNVTSAVPAGNTLGGVTAAKPATSAKPATGALGGVTDALPLPIGR